MARKGTIPASPPKHVTIFDDVYRTIVQKLAFLVIPVINETFGTHYDMDTDFAQLRNEHLELAGKIITDSIFRIGNMLYHLECQSTPDGTMSIRMFEYDVAIALENACKSKMSCHVKFPLSAVIYLRPDSSVSAPLSLNVEFPDGQSLTYHVPVINVQKYAPKEIFDKRLWLFIPFYIMRYEKQFNAMEKDAARRQAMLSELDELNSMLAEHAEDTQRFNAYTDLMHLSQKIANHLLKKQPKTKREVQKIMGGKVLELQSEKLIKKGKKAGRAEERKDGILALIAAAKDFSASPTQAAEQLMKRYSLTKEEAQTAVQANW